MCSRGDDAVSEPVQRDHWRGRHWNLAVKSGIEDGFQALVALIEDEAYDRR